jgi:lipopolysaccharide heptosyltransferase II
MRSVKSASAEKTATFRQKILIIRLSSIGDIVLTSALVRCLRSNYPDARIDFLVKKQFSEIVAHNPRLSNILVFEKGDPLKNLKRQIRNEHYDWIIDIHQNTRSFYLKSGLRVPLKTGYSKQLYHRALLVYLGLNRYREVKPVLLRYFEAVEKQGVTYDGKGTEVFVPQERVDAMNRTLMQSGYTADRKLFVLGPGASFTNKRWSPEGYASVAAHLIEKHQGFVAFIGGKNDNRLCAEIQHLVAAPTANYAGAFSILDSAALLSLCAAFVGNDSGMLHVAQALNKPVVGIYGPTVRELGYFPMADRSSVVEKPIRCRPCTHNGLNHCPKKHFLCMKTISSDDVIDAVDGLLSRCLYN